MHLIFHTVNMKCFKLLVPPFKTLCQETNRNLSKEKGTATDLTSFANIFTIVQFYIKRTKYLIYLAGTQ